MSVPYAEVIGDPIAHSKSPLIHNFWLGKLGVEGDYRATRITAGALASFLSARRADPDWRGWSVTIPHKQSIMPLLDECRLWCTHAVNCVVRENERLIGYNTDADGLAEALPERVGTAAPTCIIGAGGAASAAIGTLDILAVFKFHVIARNPAKARALVESYCEYGRVFAFDSAPEAMRNAAGLINASPLGTEGFDPMPSLLMDSLGELSRGAFVMDMVYTPVRTELLRRAAELGFFTADGLTMLIGQAAQAFGHFFGHEAPREHDAELRELLSW